MYMFVWVWADVREYSWILACGQETSSFLVYWEGMSQSGDCLSQSCCPLVCEGLIIELAQALWPNVGGTLSSNPTLLAHYLWKEVRKNCMWTCASFFKDGEDMKWRVYFSETFVTLILSPGCLVLLPLRMCRAVCVSMCAMGLARC